MRVVGLQGVDNVRDLGGTPTVDGRQVVYGRFFRGSALTRLTDTDVAMVRDELGIKHVIDLRCGWERAEKPNRSIPGIVEHHIPFYDQDIVGIEYTEPAAGTKTIGRDMACDPERFYRSLANELTVGQLRQALHQLITAGMNGEPVYFHCSGGKDRAGVLAVLLLTVLGATPAAIREDYLYTNVSRDAHYERVYRRFLRFADGDATRARELTEAHRARVDNLAAFHEAICEQYGSMTEFITTQLGIDESLRTAIRAACTTTIKNR